MKVDLVKIRYLVALSRRLSYARAAEDLGVSQPTLTRAIQSLEHQFRIRLFDRDRSGVSLTAAGRQIIDHAVMLLANADDLEVKLELTASGEAGCVRFGIQPMPARALLWSALNKQFAQSPGVANEVVVRPPEALRPLLLSGELEFFVAHEGHGFDSAPIRSETLGHSPIGVIVRSGHPLLAGKSRSERFPVLLASRAGLQLPAELSRLMLGAPHIIENYETMVKLASKSDALWPTSPYAVIEEIEEGLLCEWRRGRSLYPRPPRVMVYSLERKALSPAARSLIQSLRHSMQQLELKFSAMTKPTTGS